MRRPVSAITALAVVATIAAPVASMAAPERTKVGTLS